MPSFTQKIVAGLLLQNTGTALLDSGNYYGRSWERYRADVAASGKNPVDYFNELPAATFNAGEFSYVLHTYHWLCSNFISTALSRKLQKSFERFSKNSSATYNADMAAWCAECGAELGRSEGSDNTDSVLSDEVIITPFQYAGEALAFVQVHLGCDIRGGWTSPMIFAQHEDNFSFADGELRCEGGHSWRTDDGYHWYADFGGQMRLEEYEREEAAPDFLERVQLNKYVAEHDVTQYTLDGTTVAPTLDMRPDVLYYDGAQGYCPVCGLPLSA